MTRKYLLLFLFLQVFTYSFAQKTVPVILTAGQSNTDGRLRGVEKNGNNVDTRLDYLKSANALCMASAMSPYDPERLGMFGAFNPASGEENQPRMWAYDAVVYYMLTHDKAPACKASADGKLYVIKTSYGGTSIDPQIKCSPSKMPEVCNSWTKDYGSGYHWSADAQFLASTGIAGMPFSIDGDSAKYVGQSLLKAWIANIDAGLDALKAQGKKPEIKCMMWHQGESDRHAAKNYYENLKAMIAYVRQHLVEKTGNKKYARLPFFCGTVSHKSKQYAPAVEAALYQLEKEDKNFHVIDLQDMTLQKDQLHFDAPAAETFGKRMYQALLDNKVF